MLQSISQVTAVKRETPTALPLSLQCGKCVNMMSKSSLSFTLLLHITNFMMGPSSHCDQSDAIHAFPQSNLFTLTEFPPHDAYFERRISERRIVRKIVLENICTIMFVPYCLKTDKCSLVLCGAIDPSCLFLILYEGKPQFFFLITAGYLRPISDF